ncbi:MAG TPA: ATP-binding protein, partial [Thermoplasmata archaeon]|nr:ATP-binding protein [Thermoplasmata archaeon]
PATRDVRLRTIEDARPRGICGSGIVDAIAEMFRSGIIDPSGRIKDNKGDKRVRKGPDGVREYVLVWGKDTDTGEDITVAQHDIEEIQLAKAAIFTGVSTLMRKLGVKCHDLKRVYAAGAFGTYVDASSAITIGMYPDVPVTRIRFVGNAAGSGARMALKSTHVRDLAERLSKKVEYIELAAEKDFQSEFAKAMFLPHRDAGRFPSVKTRRD